MCVTPTQTSDTDDAFREIRAAFGWRSADAGFGNGGCGVVGGIAFGHPVAGDIVDLGRRSRRPRA